VTTNDASLAEKIRMLRDHGQVEKYYHGMEGYNGRLDAIQAGILRLKLQFLAEWNTQRRERAEVYRNLFSSPDELVLPLEPDWSRAIYHLYVIRLRDREKLRKHLAAAHIGTGIHYPIPLHLQSAYGRLGYREGDFPVTEKVAAEILSLPMYPQLGRAEQERVAEAVLEYLQREAESPISPGTRVEAVA